jgi:hypothetical protein
MKRYFYIGDDIVTTKSNDLNAGVRIFCEETKHHPFVYKKIDGPFSSLRQLRKQSNIFKRLVKSDTKRVQQILDFKNIIDIPYDKPIIFVKKSGYSQDFINLFTHTYLGNIQSEKIFGVHYFDNTRMKIIKTIASEDSNNVWKALVEIFDVEKQRCYKKESTFFPKDWTLNRLFHECDFACQSKVKVKDTQYIYSAKTLSGVPVEIILRDDILKSIYPIYST